VTVREWLAHAEARLRDAGIESARLESQVLAAHVAGVDRSWLFAHPDEEFLDLPGEHVLQRREAHEPLAYILGRREFYGRTFSVDRRVLIPRHETETLVETALRHAPEGARVLDLGTGSGCISITLKLERPDLRVTASDVSEGALEVARTNAEALGAEVEFVHSDAFEQLLGESFALIVSNPPYIGRHEPLASEVADYEPELALYGGDEGDEFLQSLAAQAANYLRTGGRIALEVGYRQAALTRELFEAQGWQHVETVRDLSGTDRVVVMQAVFACAVG
jgi:release factor glutamine methyltransferase